jgi:hypothetical protein
MRISHGLPEKEALNTLQRRCVERRRRKPIGFIHAATCCKVVDADNPDRVIAFKEGNGATIGNAPEGLGKMDVSGTRKLGRCEDRIGH